MLVAAILVSAFFLVSMIAVIVLLVQFAQLKATATIAEAAYNNNTQMMMDVREFVGTSFESLDQRYTEIQSQYATAMDSNHRLQQELNDLKDKMRQPLAPDCTFN